MLRTLVCSCAAVGVLVGQSQTQPHFVLIALAGNPAAQVVQVDPVLGTSQSIGAFPSDSLAPLAMVQDPYDGDLLVALDQTGGMSHIVRLHRFSGTYLEFSMAFVPGHVADLVISEDTLLIAVDDAAGGVYTAPRRGGAATLALPQANLTAMNAFGQGLATLALAWTGRPGTSVLDSGVGIYNVPQSIFYFGPFSFGNPGNVEITGVMDMVTAVPRQVLSFDDGSFAVFSGFTTPALQSVPVIPALPSGAATAFHARGPYSFDGVAIGNAAYPFLYSIDPWSGALSQLSMALPGSPVDFSLGLDLAAHSLPRGQECGAQSLQQWSASPAQLGGTLSVQVHAAVGLPVLFIAGLDDFALTTLPAVLPGGCFLEVVPDVLLLEFASLAGVVVETIPVPALPALIGTIVHTQWAHYDPSGLSTSNAYAHWIGN